MGGKDFELTTETERKREGTQSPRARLESQLANLRETPWKPKVQHWAVTGAGPCGGGAGNTDPTEGVEGAPLGAGVAGVDVHVATEVAVRVSHRCHARVVARFARVRRRRRRCLLESVRQRYEARRGRRRELFEAGGSPGRGPAARAVSRGGGGRGALCPAPRVPFGFGAGTRPAEVRPAGWGSSYCRAALVAARSLVGGWSSHEGDGRVRPSTRVVFTLRGLLGRSSPTRRTNYCDKVIAGLLTSGLLPWFQPTLEGPHEESERELGENGKRGLSISKGVDILWK